MQYEYILMVIPIIIIVAFLVVIAKRMTDGERPDISGAVLGTIIIAVGLLIMVPIISSVDPQYEYDDEDKTFTLYKNVTGTDFSWGSAADAESLIIEDTVTTISAGAFASFSDLKYISIPESLETIGEGAFPTLKDYLDQTITEPEAGEYAGFGDGTLYLCDPTIFTYLSTGTGISGLASTATGAVNLVIPTEYQGVKITSISSSSFESNTTIQLVKFLPDTELNNLGGSNTFSGCTSLAMFEIPESVTKFGSRIAYGAPIENLVIPDGALEFRANAFNGNHTEELSFPDTTTFIGSYAFDGSYLTTLSLGSGIETIESRAFRSTSITSVTFADGFAATSLASDWNTWTFYDSDGTTQLDKTVASNLAGFTFQGTASALVKVLPDRSTLTAAQTLQVQELTKEAAKASKLEEAELQISEKTELAEA